MDATPGKSSQQLFEPELEREVGAVRSGAASATPGGVLSMLVPLFVSEAEFAGAARSRQVPVADWLKPWACRRQVSTGGQLSDTQHMGALVTDEMPSLVPLRPIAVTLLACAAFIALLQFPIPGLPAHSPLDALRVGSLGITPILEGFILVELVAVAIPGLRRLRTTAEGQALLRRQALTVALLIVAFQTFGIMRYAQSLKELDSASILRPGAADPRLSLGVFLPLGVGAIVALASLIDTAGIGAGYSLLIATGSGFLLVGGLLQAMQQTSTESFLRFLLPLAIFGVAAWKMLATAPYRGSRARYRLPTPGLEPVHYGVLIAFAALQTNLAGGILWPLVPKGVERVWAWRAVQLLATLGWCTLLSRVQHRAATQPDQDALARAGRASTLWLAALTIGTWFVDDAATGGRAGVDVFALVALIAVGMDLRGELKATWRLGRQRVLRELHRLEDADALSAALGAAGIESALRGAHHRALYQFFAPFIPIGVLVAERDLERATVVAHEHEMEVAAPLFAPPEGAPTPG